MGVKTEFGRRTRPNSLFKNSDEQHVFIGTEVEVQRSCQRLWFQPHWRAAAMLLRVPRERDP